MHGLLYPCIIFIERNNIIMAKNRKQKEKEYKEKFSNIPIDFNERLNYMYDLYGFENKPNKITELEMKRNNMVNNSGIHEF